MPPAVMNSPTFARLLVLLSLAASARAATFTVTTVEEEFNTPSGTSVSLAEALRDAASNPGPDTIVFDARLSGATLNLRSEFTITDTSDVTVDASGLRGGLTLSANGSNRIFNVPDTGSLILQGLTLTNGGGGNTGGGAIYNNGVLVLTACALTGNNSSELGGGAILNRNGKATLTSCTLSGNSTRGGGGAILTSNGGVTLTHCTLSQNSAGRGGGVHVVNHGELTLIHSIVGGNSAQSGADLYNEASVVSLGVNLVQGFAGAAASGNSFLTSAPLLSPLANHGGPTKTHQLLPGSPARNSAVGSGQVRDQRGYPIVATPDIGAYETQIGPIPTVYVNQNTSSGPISFPIGIVGFLTVSSSDPRLLQNSGIVLGGTPPNLTVTLTPVPGGFGLVIITLQDPDSGELTHFFLQINNAPSITSVADTTIIENTHTEALAFDVDDTESGPSGVSVTADTSNTTLVTLANIVLGGSGSARTVTVTPEQKQVGTATIMLTASDGNRTTTVSFQLTVLPDTPLTSWKIKTFGNEASVPEVGGDLADPDHDGVSNLLEFALRTSPSDASPLPFGPAQPVSLPGNIPARRFVFPYRPDAANLSYVIQFSKDLTTWTDIYKLDLLNNSVTQAAGVTGDTDALAETVTVTITKMNYFNGSNYWRLGVESQ